MRRIIVIAERVELAEPASHAARANYNAKQRLCALCAAQRCGSALNNEHDFPVRLEALDARRNVRNARIGRYMCDDKCAGALRDAPTSYLRRQTRLVVCSAQKAADRL